MLLSIMPWIYSLPKSISDKLAESVCGKAILRPDLEAYQEEKEHQFPYPGIVLEQ
jgi:hypothetical protein